MRVVRVPPDVVQKEGNFGAVLHRGYQKVDQLEPPTPLVLTTPLSQHASPHDCVTQDRAVILRLLGSLRGLRHKNCLKNPRDGWIRGPEEPAVGGGEWKILVTHGQFFILNFSYYDLKYAMGSTQFLGYLDRIQDI